MHLVGCFYEDDIYTRKVESRAWQAFEILSLYLSRMSVNAEMVIDIEDTYQYRGTDIEDTYRYRTHFYRNQRHLST
jgi:hypothetical protein